jgi:hypothetical protein
MHPGYEAARTGGPKQKDRRHYSYDEGSDEPATLIESETVDIEKEVPADETEPVERVKEDDTEARPVFEE